MRIFSGRQGTVLVIISLLFLMSSTTFPTSGQSVLTSNTDNELYFWRANMRQFEIIDAHIFPILSINGDLDNLGNAWIAWTINTTDGLLAANALYSQGEPIVSHIGNTVFSNMSWYSLESTLINVGITNNRTIIRLFFDNGQFITRDIPGTTVDHQLFAISDQNFFLWANNTGKGGIYERYTLVQQVNLRTTLTTEIVETAGNGGAVIRNDTHRVFYQASSTNYTVPESLSDNLRIGHVQLNPAVYDLDKQNLWIPILDIFMPFPLGVNIDEINFFGLQSSILLTNSTFYELNDKGDWQVVGSFDVEPFDFAIVDIGLYLGPVIKEGLGLVTSGTDLDQDFIPDTMEDYFGSLPTTNDTDGDGISDKDEIVNGIDPAVKDNLADTDNDRISNQEEIQLGLDPINADSDYGGAIDGWEVRYNYDPFSPIDDQLDDDEDGILNDRESVYNTNPRSADTDNDGMPDNWEINVGLNPILDDADLDPDGDGETNLDEYRANTDPLVKNPTELFEGAYLELSLILVISLPIGLITWYYYPKEINA